MQITHSIKQSSSSQPQAKCANGGIKIYSEKSAVAGKTRSKVLSILILICECLAGELLTKLFPVAVRVHDVASVEYQANKIKMFVTFWCEGTSCTLHEHVASRSTYLL